MLSEEYAAEHRAQGERIKRWLVGTTICCAVLWAAILAGLAFGRYMTRPTEIRVQSLQQPAAIPVPR